MRVVIDNKCCAKSQVGSIANDAADEASKGLVHSRFGGPGERNPCSREPAVLRPRAFFLTPRQHCKSFAAKRKFFVQDESRPPRNDSRRLSGKKKECHEIPKYLQGFAGGTGSVACDNRIRGCQQGIDAASGSRQRQRKAIARW